MSLFTLLVHALLLFSVTLATGSDGEYRSNSLWMVCIATIFLIVETPHVFSLVEEQASPRPLLGHRTRNQRSVSSIFLEMGPTYVCQGYCMDEDSFWQLHAMLKPFLEKRRSKKKKHQNGAKNGLIQSSVQLSAALRYFASGSPYDIALVHGISHSEVFTSVWRVVDAVNKCPALEFHFPASHNKQREIAKAFAEKSTPGFKCCVGCIDGMLLWIKKPSKDECEEAQCGSGKFFCGRKSKFGLNLQGTCDSEGHFLDVSMGHPTSTSNYLSFSTSSLQAKLEKARFLAEGLSLFIW
jgi:hypothetical protein